MTDPSGIQPDNSISLGDEMLEYGKIDTGVPHVVLMVNDIESLDVRSRGRSIRYHERFREEGTNVDFIQLKGDNHIQVRTYERGVEDETLSCGTGAVASALMTAAWTGATGPIRVETASGENLQVSFNEKSGRFNSIILRGEARVVYYGVMSEI
jgi:diaminopimelate epimerase